MANFYTHTCTQISHVSADEARWLSTEHARLSGSCSFDLTRGDDETFFVEGCEIIVEQVCAFLQRFLGAHRPDEQIVLGYACTVSPMKPGGFSGGAVLVEAGGCIYFDGLGRLQDLLVTRQRVR